MIWNNNVQYACCAADKGSWKVSKYISNGNKMAVHMGTAGVTLTDTTTFANFPVAIPIKKVHSSSDKAIAF
jgi:hypothetical protein